MFRLVGHKQTATLGEQTITITGLTAGPWFFVVSVIDQREDESVFAPEVSKFVKVADSPKQAVLTVNPPETRSDGKEFRQVRRWKVVYGQTQGGPYPNTHLHTPS